ncbi:hypothetical protein FRC04_000915 [Tulasnella sp. 424]|nr:hypothetical protein FRC04_000915 [Tulasnella sp. 424]KAG8977832.1 hypothetical protein FRC05_000360 [Tulasnella sp. 425]
MAGSKRSRVKAKAAEIIDSLSPSQSPPTVEDDELLDDLLAQIDNNPGSSPEAIKVLKEVDANQSKSTSPPLFGMPGKKKDPKAKFQERQAKKAAALAAAQPADDKEAQARLEKEKAEEERAIRSVCDSLGLEIYEINPDGHCMFSAIADQLCQLGMITAQQANYKLTRAVASDYMLAHPNDFLPFIPSLGGEDGVGATDETGLLTPAQFSKYCATVRDTGAWGGEPEIMALSRAYQVPIHVVQWGAPPIVCHSPTGTEVNPSLPSVKHYNSLRPKRISIPGQNLLNALLS